MIETPETKPPCADCIRARGLCSNCARVDRSLLPQLAKNIGWLKLIGDAMCEQRKRQHAEAPSPEAERIRARKERKRAKRATRPPRPSKLERRLRGEHTRAA